jgi:hypothetical protein
VPGQVLVLGAGGGRQRRHLLVADVRLDVGFLRWPGSGTTNAKLPSQGPMPFRCGPVGVAGRVEHGMSGLIVRMRPPAPSPDVR